MRSAITASCVIHKDVLKRNLHENTHAQAAFPLWVKELGMKHPPSRSLIQFMSVILPISSSVLLPKLPQTIHVKTL